jgi:hypothetical protein
MPRASRPITFTCSWCYKDVTEERMPGPTPAYCLVCRDEARRSTEAGRAKRYRERQAEQDTRNWWDKPRPGRPRKG